MRLFRLAAAVAVAALITVPAAVAAKGTNAECPHDLHCNFVPAAYHAQNWGDKAVTGESFAVAERAGDWVAIWYGGQKTWLYDPKGKNTIPGGGTLVTPKAGVASIPVYGRAYPSSVSTATLGYTVAAGQTYVARDLVNADYYSASTYNAPDTYAVIESDEQFY